MENRNSGDIVSSRAAAPTARRAESPLRARLRAVLAALLLWASWSAVNLLYRSPDQISVSIGQASPRDIKARYPVSYVSEVKTREAQAAAAAKVPVVYTQPDMALAARQVSALEQIVASITAIRNDVYTPPERKLELLRGIPSLQMPAASLAKILILDSAAWQRVVTESERVLDIVMRNEIREDGVADARRLVDRLIDRSLDDQQREAVNALVQSLVVANSRMDTAETLAERQAAIDAVEPVHWSILRGEAILREGEIVSELAYEKLQVSGLIVSGITPQQAVAAVLLPLVLVALVSLTVAHISPLLVHRPRRLLLLFLALLAVGLMARFTVPGHTLLPYLIPFAAAAMVVAIFLEAPLAILVALVSAILVGYNAGGSLELTVYVLLGSLAGALSLLHVEQLSAFLRAMAYVALANILAVLAFRLDVRQLDATGLIQLTAMAAGNAVLAAIVTFVAYTYTAKIFGITTSLQLLELARPNHPLFRQLLLKAPGTYHHSIVISNMAERAAEAIGADALLARVGSYYHDVGKTVRAYFFSENQADGENPHDALDPKTSAAIVISHTAEGLELAAKYRLPDKVRAFIPEHHGTGLATYFFRKASQQADGQDIDERDFRYPGPKPQSKETAIVMLADGIEAWSRANRPSTQAEMERVIRQVMNDRLVSGQLDDSALTLKELDRIRESFISVLQSIYHPRIQYPEPSVGRGNGRGAQGTSA